MSSAGLDAFCEAHATDLGDLVAKFSDYEPTGGFDKADLRKWLSAFSPQDRPLALQLARYIRYYGTNKINGLMGGMYQLIEQQKLAEKGHHQEVFYVPFGRSGESGEDIVRRYRNANRLHKWQEQFVSVIELRERVWGATRPIVFFLDDFVGTGKQVSAGWQDTYGQVVPDYVPLYLVVIAGVRDGIREVERNTPLRVLCLHTIGPELQLRESACKAFSSREKLTIENYCKRAGNLPLGFGQIGLLLSFAYGTPNDTISIIRGSERQRPFPGLLPNWRDKA